MTDDRHEDEAMPLFAPCRVGELEVVTLRDGHRSFPLAEGELVTNATMAEVNAALAEAGMPPDRMTIVFNPVLVRTAIGPVLFDTGNGPQPEGSTVGLTMRSLAAAGVAPGDIVRAVISHFHADHINGLLDEGGAPAFPAAAILVPEREWTFWNDAGERARAAPGRMQDLFANVARVFGPLRDRVRTYRAGEEVAPGIVAVDTPGHSIGHTSFMLESAGARLFLQSDVTNHPALFARHPDWQARFDQDPAQAVATRRRVYERLVEERILIQGFHFPFPARGHAERAGDGYRIVSPD
jgi:glyoxylase-like metal-dependent hydrolase (beta-lactamase superfamily II)